MSFQPNGNAITQRIVFNSGYLDFGLSRLVEVDSLNLRVEWNINDLYVLNSIKRQDIARSQMKVSLTGKIKSFAPEFDMIALGESTLGTPNEIDALDGQPTLQTPILNVYDRNNKQIQYQLQGAIVKSSAFSARAEEYAEYDFEIEAKDIVELYTS